MIMAEGPGPVESGIWPPAKTEVPAFEPGAVPAWRPRGSLPGAWTLRRAAVLRHGEDGAGSVMGGSPGTGSQHFQRHLACGPRKRAVEVGDVSDRQVEVQRRAIFVDVRR